MATLPMKTQCSLCSYKSGILCLLSDYELEGIDRSRYEISFKQGETIFKQGGPLTHVACISEGMAKVYLEGDKSKNVILRILQPKEVIIGPGFLVDHRHHYSVSALTDIKACFIDVESFTNSANNNSGFSMEIIKYRNRSTIFLHNKLLTLMQNYMSGRLAETLLYLSRVIYKSETFETTLSRQDLADMSAMRKESSIRILKEFKDENVIDLEGNTFHILDIEKLERMCRVS